MSLKPPTTIEQQKDLMKSRGCTIEDEQFCMEVLSNVNYYRLSAYFLPFRNADRVTYKQNTTFSQIYDIYKFDSQMRGLILSAIERIEIYTRAKIAYYHAHKYGPLGYEDAKNFNKKHDSKGFMILLANEKKKNKNVLFVKHHIQNYGGDMPIWAIVELFSFGMMSRFYSVLLLTDRKALADELFNVSESLASSWLHCCTNLRNICAHYGRLYFRLLGTTPLTPKGYAYTLDRSLFSALTMLKLMFMDKDGWNAIVEKIDAIAQEYSSSIDLNHIGFPSKWKKQLVFGT